MGGFGSGRTGNRGTVESGLVLDMAALMRQHMMMPDSSASGSLSWHSTLTGKPSAAIDYNAILLETYGTIRLRYVTHFRGGGAHHSDDTIRLVTTPQPFGGLRWWFLCPRSGRRCAKLYLPDGAVLFASRQAHGIDYRCQRTSKRDQAFARAHDRRRRLGARGALGDYIPKPKGMRWATFEKKLAAVKEAEGVCLAHSHAFLEALKRRH